MNENVKSVVRKTLGRHGMRALRQVMGKIAYHRVEVSVPLALVGRGGDEFQLCPAAFARRPIVYSLGIGTMINSDLDMIERYGASVFAFDPTPESQDWLRRQRLPERFVAMPYGVAPFDGKARFFQHDGAQYSLRPITEGQATDALEVRRLQTLMDLFGHTSIDLLKIDIEGGEYEVIPDVIGSGIRPRQLMIEFHHRLPGYHISQTYGAVRRLRAAGYLTIAISDLGREYTFLHASFARALRGKATS